MVLQLREFFKILLSEVLRTVGSMVHVTGVSVCKGMGAAEGVEGGVLSSCVCDFGGSPCGLLYRNLRVTLRGFIKEKIGNGSNYKSKCVCPIGYVGTILVLDGESDHQCPDVVIQL